MSPEDVRKVIEALGSSNALDLVLPINWSDDSVALSDLEYALTAPSEDVVQAVTAFVNAG